MSGAESGDEALLLAAMGFAAFGKPRRSQQWHEAETVGLPQLMPGTELASQQAAFPSGSVEAGDHGVLYLLTREPQDGSDLELAAALRGEAGEGGVGQKVEERALLETLATEKRKFDALESARFLRARAATNRFEGLGRHRFVNRSAMKLVTLDHIFKWTRKLPREREAWSFADICGGPGGFAEYLLWRGEQEKSEGADDTLRVRGYGISLKDAANDCDWRVPPQPHALFQACYGQDGTGNLYSLANIHCFRDLVRGQHPLGVDLAVADGGFLEARSQANQEAMMTRLVLAEVLAMFGVLRVDGDFVCKTFELATPAMLELCWLLHQCFQQFAVVKPVTSRPASSERYLIARGLRTGHPTPELVEILEDRLVQSSGDAFPFHFLPNNSLLREDAVFLQYIEAVHQTFTTSQIEACRRINEWAANHKKRKQRDNCALVDPRRYYQCWQLGDMPHST